jgi:UDP-N-acetyl-D-glucosamine dehydrogenase
MKRAQEPAANLATRRDHLKDLLSSIENRTAVVGVIGLGYVGLPLVLLFVEAGFPVFGFDVDEKKTAALQRGDSYIRHIGPERVADAVRNNRFSATTDFEQIRRCDAVIICVPTPLGVHREPDLTYIRLSGDEIAARLRPGQLVVLESTTYPGTTREEMLVRLERNGLRCGEDFFLAFSPEREDPGNREFSTRDIPKVVGGMDVVSRDAAVALYGSIVRRVVPVSSPEVAESAKLLENVFRAVNIALVNELKIVFDRMGIDVWEVIEAAEYGGWTRFIELAGEVNTSMPRYVVGRVSDAVNQQGKSIVGAKVLVLGLSYKPDVDDDRESPSFEIIELLQDRGAIVAYCDPYIPAARKGRKYDLRLTSTACSAEEFTRYDALVLATAHRQFKDPALYAGVKLAIDTRNVIPPGPGRVVVKA